MGLIKRLWHFAFRVVGATLYAAEPYTIGEQKKPLVSDFTFEDRQNAKDKFLTIFFTKWSRLIRYYEKNTPIAENMLASYRSLELS